ncbi:MAG: insulinase family protein, partial [Rhodospirillaceae bacterium]|nr:insulinase family protein [Rhodospirillaceae bacterium]
MRVFQIGAVVSMAYLAGWHGVAGAAVFNPETFTLSNGMQVVVITNRRAPIVAHMVWYKVGAADESEGKSGIAHFFEHLMFKGTKSVPPGEFSKIVARNGGSDNAFTTHDYTAYFQKVAKDRLALVMELEADRMINLVLSDDVVLSERKVILEE